MDRQGQEFIAIGPVLHGANGRWLLAKATEKYDERERLAAEILSRRFATNPLPGQIANCDNGRGPWRLALTQFPVAALGNRLEFKLDMFFAPPKDDGQARSLKMEMVPPSSNPHLTEFTTSAPDWHHLSLPNNWCNAAHESRNVRVYICHGGEKRDGRPPEDQGYEKRDGWLPEAQEYIFSKITEIAVPLRADRTWRLVINFELDSPDGSAAPSFPIAYSQQTLVQPLTSESILDSIQIWVAVEGIACSASFHLTFVARTWTGEVWPNRAYMFAGKLARAVHDTYGGYGGEGENCIRTKLILKLAPRAA